MLPDPQAGLPAARRSGDPADLRDEMVALLIDRRASAEAVTVDDLRIHGFTDTEITLGLSDAVEIATARTATRRIRPARRAA